MDAFQKGWYTELSPDDTMWPGQAMSLQVEEVLLDERSEYQHIQVLRTATYGVMLCLDGVIQITERDECSYQEMIAHVPMCAHSAKPAHRVAVIGGGDGGVLREVTKHTSVDVVDHCEIDRRVCEVALQYLPQIASGLAHPRVTSHYEDGAAWLRAKPGFYDVIIVDSSDPVGPAASLYSLDFYEVARRALAPGGILCTQAECLWNNLDLIAELVRDAQTLFAQVRYTYTTVPTYPSGQIGFLLCTDSTESVEQPQHAPPPALRYYSPELHSASFVLPKFAERIYPEHTNGARPATARL
jgi:spermidine synthase|eukprot:COSAG01_NODE_7923_length_2991_cov_9.959889_1_plen_299_part_00